MATRQQGGRMTSRNRRSSDPVIQEAAALGVKVWKIGIGPHYGYYTRPAAELARIGGVSVGEEKALCAAEQLLDRDQLHTMTANMSGQQIYRVAIGKAAPTQSYDRYREAAQELMDDNLRLREKLWELGVDPDG